MKTRFLLSLIVFFILNFGALAIGRLFTGSGVPSDWYVNLNKAPWTPPGWVFGAAWTTIMICFSIFMAYAWSNNSNRRLLLAMYVIQLILNIAWNPLFFHFHAMGIALIDISALTILVASFIFVYRKEMNFKVFLISPYFIWLCIATSLNAYALLSN